MSPAFLIRGWRFVSCVKGLRITLARRRWPHPDHDTKIDPKQNQVILFRLPRAHSDCVGDSDSKEATESLTRTLIHGSLDDRSLDENEGRT